MKVIKFKGKRIDNNEWVYGDLVHINGRSLIYHAPSKSTNQSEILEANAIDLLKSEASVVYDDSVGQFTGVCDKNGNEIYEGDRVMIEYSNETMLGQVFWRNFICAWCIRIDNGASECTTQISKRLTEMCCKVIN